MCVWEKCILGKLSRGNPQFRRKKENKRQAEESVECLRRKRNPCTRVNSKRKADADTFMLSKRRKPRVAKEVERFSLSNVQVVESEVDGGLVGRPLPSSSRCEFWICVILIAILKAFFRTKLARIFAKALIRVLSLLGRFTCFHRRMATQQASRSSQDDPWRQKEEIVVQGLWSNQQTSV